MGVCCCSLAGTSACQYCSNNSIATASDNISTEAYENYGRAFVIQDSKPITNADKIRTMTDEELAWFIYTKTGCDHKCMHWKSKICTNADTVKVCGEVWLDWLKEECDGE